jgi:hypothetical protein
LEKEFIRCIEGVGVDEALGKGGGEEGREGGRKKGRKEGS